MARILAWGGGYTCGMTRIILSHYQAQPLLQARKAEETRDRDRFRTRIERLGRIRQLVFGSLDGLLVPLGVISGVAGGTGDTKAVIVAGIAEAFAGALSMGAGEFISGRSGLGYLVLSANNYFNTALAFTLAA